MRDMSTQEEERKNGVTKHQFYFETPLYEMVKDSDLIEDIFSGDVDASSAKNDIETTYEIKSRDVDDYSADFDDFQKITLTCKRKNNDILRFFVGQGEDFIVKVGQWPSLADIQSAEIDKKYNKQLKRPELKDFKRAIGLAAHGVGVGSFVYLRRVFEKLIIGTYLQYKDEQKIDEAEFAAKRMADKIDILRGYLPSHLVEMKDAYGILSKGIHELSEQECREHFKILKLSIELILDQQIELDAKQERDLEVKKQLKDLGAKLKP